MKQSDILFTEATRKFLIFGIIGYLGWAIELYNFFNWIKDKTKNLLNY